MGGFLKVVQLPTYSSIFLLAERTSQLRDSELGFYLLPWWEKIPATHNRERNIGKYSEQFALIKQRRKQSDCCWWGKIIATEQICHICSDSHFLDRYVHFSPLLHPFTNSSQTTIDKHAYTFSEHFSMLFCKPQYFCNSCIISLLLKSGSFCSSLKKKSLWLCPYWWTACLVSSNNCKFLLIIPIKVFLLKVGLHSKIY